MVYGKGIFSTGFMYENIPLKQSTEDMPFTVPADLFYF